MLYAERVGEGIETNATYSDKELMRSIPGSRFTSPPPLWTVPLSWAACKQLRGIFGERLEIGPGLREWAQRDLEERVLPALRWRMELDAEADPIPLRPPAGLKLRTFQEADVRFMLAAGSGLLMHVPGAGKTISALTWMRNNAFDRVLVIGPAAARLVWAEETPLWYPELEVIPIIGPAGQRREKIEEVGSYGGLAVMSYDAARIHTRLAPYGQIELSETEKKPKDLNFQDWDVVIVDEAHRLGDPKSKQTRACWAVGHQPGVRYRWGLTATPTRKGLDTLWPALHFYDPVEHPTRSKFIERYCVQTTDFWGNVTIGTLRPEMEREYRDIIDPRTRNLPKEIALPGVPPVIPVKRMLKMGKEQAAAYKQMVEDSLAELDNGDVVVATSTAAQYTRLGQFASSYAYTEDRPARDRKTGEMVMKTFVELQAPSNKIDAFLDDLRDWLAQEESIVAFATSRRLINLLSATLDKKKIRHSAIVGGQSDMERHEQIRAYQQGEVPLILVVISAGGSSLTLTRGRVMAVLQRSWANWEDKQMEGRLPRIGSEHHANILRVDYITEDTTDVGQLDVLQAKEDIMQVVLRDRETIEKMMRGGHVAAPEPKETAVA